MQISYVYFGLISNFLYNVTLSAALCFVEFIDNHWTLYWKKEAVKGTKRLRRISLRRKQTYLILNSTGVIKMKINN